MEGLIMQRRHIIALVSTGALITPAALGVHTGTPPAHASSRPRRRLVNETPDLVTRGQAARLGAHKGSDLLTLDIGLAPRNTAQLDNVIAASDPASPSYGHYLTNAEYLATYAPTASAAAAVRSWAAGQDLNIVATSPDNLLVTVKGTTTQVNSAFNTTINDYKTAGRVFRSNVADVSVPANLDISAVSGFTTLHLFHTFNTGVGHTRLAGRAAVQPRALRACGYIPSDFRAAYNTKAVGDGPRQTVGFTLWGGPLAQSDLTAFASNTSSTPVTVGGIGANGVEFVPVNGGSTDTLELAETALDVESAHGVSNNAHLRYWLSDCTPTFTTSGAVCNPSDTGLEMDISDAANDSSLHVSSPTPGVARPLARPTPSSSTRGPRSSTPPPWARPSISRPATAALTSAGRSWRATPPTAPTSSP